MKHSQCPGSEMKQSNFCAAVSALDEMQDSSPPPQEPRSAKEFTQINSTRINKLIASGWPVAEIANRLAATGVKISASTLRLYLKPAVAKKHSRTRAGVIQE